MSQLSRRTLVSTAAALPALAVPALSLPANAGADDTLVRIERHRELQASIHKILKRQAQLEEELPAERCRAYSIDHRGTDIGANDDPRWTENNADYWAAEDELDAIAWSFVDRPPTTVASATALLAYANEYEDQGYEWPDRRDYFEADGSYSGYEEENWRLGMNKSLASLGTNSRRPPKRLRAA
jgi:hypothetical protein